MYKKILVPMALDHDISPDTLAIAHSLRAEGAVIMALHVYDVPDGMAAAYLEADEVRKGFERARQTLEQKTEGLDGVQAQIVTGHTYRSIIDFAVEQSVDCIVIGSHKPGLSDFLLGSTAARVVRHAPCSVHVHRAS